MKLVEILARELKVWPDQYYQIYQDSGGNLIGTLTNGDLEDCNSEDLPFGPVTIAWDGNSAIVERIEWQAAVDALKAEEAPAWVGVGLPPVGTVCEYHVGNGPWFKGEIRYLISPISGQPKEVVLFASHLKGEQVGVIGTGEGEVSFRPIRTPEQIAGDQYEEDAAEIAKILIDLKNADEIFVAKTLLDCGYRKFEIVDKDDGEEV